ncbi:conserved Plasmodium protein, unknown function [Plasmodium relictum]|uniref:Protein kinase domain-containing protein n=1 Tax=Plasmodium relictum TaxID=85471 RepID=A0A1J1H501_PLARL|nr:conserved Plasmodium protein, unknown function [Plasmodium relictum]CRG99991.1 conserved Plasmodium protein, unknown function [Plasmodium relictum]
MFKKDIKNIYIKNYIKKIYIVKRYNENNTIEEKKSSILYKDFNDFIIILVNIRKYEKTLKKLKSDKSKSDFSKILLEYLDFYIANFGYKFHSFILEYKSDLITNDLNNCYVIDKLKKCHIESVVRNEYSRILFKYDSIKYLLYYIKKHIILFDTFNTNFQKLLVKYLSFALNPLNLLIFVYLKVYNKNGMNIKEENVCNKKKTNNQIICENKESTENNIELSNELCMNNLNKSQIFDSSNFFCNDLYSFICFYGEYITKYTIIRCYSEICANKEPIKRKLKIYHWIKNKIRNDLIQKICSNKCYKNLKLSDQINENIFNFYESNLNKYSQNLKRFTEVGSGFKCIKMSHKNFSYIYELVLLLYFIKKCLFNLNENINMFFQVFLYSLFKTIKMIIIYLYFNLPQYLCHYFLNIYLLFFKSKKKQVNDVLKKMKNTYKNIMSHIYIQKKIYFKEKICKYTGIKKPIEDKKRSNKTTFVKVNVNNVEGKKYKKILNLTYFEIKNYNGKKQNRNELRKFKIIHSYGAVIQLKYNNELFLREKKKNNKKKFQKKKKKKKIRFIYPNRFESMKRYSLLYRIILKNKFKKNRRSTITDLNIQENSMNYLLDNALINNYNDNSALKNDEYFNYNKINTNSRENYYYKKNILNKLFKSIFDNLCKENKFILNERNKNILNSENNVCNKDNYINYEYSENKKNAKSEENIINEIKEICRTDETNIISSNNIHLHENAQFKNEIKLSNLKLSVSIENNSTENYNENEKNGKNQEKVEKEEIQEKKEKEEIEETEEIQEKKEKEEIQEKKEKEEIQEKKEKEEIQEKVEKEEIQEKKEKEEIEEKEEIQEKKEKEEIQEKVEKEEIQEKEENEEKEEKEEKGQNKGNEKTLEVEEKVEKEEIQEIEEREQNKESEKTLEIEEKVEKEEIQEIEEREQNKENEKKLEVEGKVEKEELQEIEEREENKENEKTLEVVEKVEEEIQDIEEKEEIEEREQSKENEKTLEVEKNEENQLSKIKNLDNGSFSEYENFNNNSVYSNEFSKNNKEKEYYNGNISKEKYCNNINDIRDNVSISCKSDEKYKSYFTEELSTSEKLTSDYDYYLKIKKDKKKININTIGIINKTRKNRKNQEKEKKHIKLQKEICKYKYPKDKKESNTSIENDQKYIKIDIQEKEIIKKKEKKIEILNAGIESINAENEVTEYKQKEIVENEKEKEKREINIKDIEKCNKEVLKEKIENNFSNDKMDNGYYEDNIDSKYYEYEVDTKYNEEKTENKCIEVKIDELNKDTKYTEKDQNLFTSLQSECNKLNENIKQDECKESDESIKKIMENKEDNQSKEVDKKEYENSKKKKDLKKNILDETGLIENDSLSDDTLKTKNSKKLIFNLSLSDSEESLILESVENKKMKTHLNDVKENFFDSDKENDILEKLSESSDLIESYEKKCDKMEDLKILHEHFELKHEYNDAKNVEVDKSFIDTCEIYLNEKLATKRTSCNKFKLVIIYLFDHYIIGGINLINPYKSGENERYVYFTNIQSNINDIDHTKIFRYNDKELIETFKRNSEICLLSDKNEKRIMKILSKCGKGLNGSIFKCKINGKLLACKVQHKLILAKKEIYFSYLLKVRKCNKFNKYSKNSDSYYSNKNIFFEIYEHENKYIFPDELHYKVNHEADNSITESSKIANEIKRNDKNQNKDKGLSILLMKTHNYVITLNELINNFIRKNHKCINEELILFILYQIIVAVLQLHVLDILHGDIKIDNFLIIKNEKLCDGGRNNINNNYKKKKEKKDYNTKKKEKNYILNDKLNNYDKNTFLKNEFPLNLFLIDIGRGIDVKNFKKYLFYGEKNCDCYSFLNESIYNYHIDFIGIAQIASCLLFYKHIGHMKYKYEHSIEDKNNIIVNNLGITYSTHNNHFFDNKKKKKNLITTNNNKYREIENFIKLKEKIYQEKKEIKDDKPFKNHPREYKNNMLHGIDKVKYCNDGNNNKKKEQKQDGYQYNEKENKINKAGVDENNDLDNIYFKDYSKNLYVDEKNYEKINHYLNQIKKQAENYFVEKDNKNKIKNFNIKLILKRKKYSEFWEMFFHILLNFCNVYELNSVHYNSNEINKDPQKNCYHKLINKTYNYYFDFDKNNWEEINKNDKCDFSIKENRNYSFYCDKKYSTNDFDKNSKLLSNNLYYDNNINYNKKHSRYLNDDNVIKLKKRNLNTPLIKEKIDNSLGNNNKYFFIKNSISNFKNIRKTLYVNKHNIEKNKNKDINKEDSYTNGKGSKLINKRKLIFFENEQNKTKCRKLNNEKYYTECDYNNAKKSTKYITKLMKKKAIFILLNLKRIIERIFDDDEEKQRILLSELYTAATFF